MVNEKSARTDIGIQLYWNQQEYTSASGYQRKHQVEALSERDQVQGSQSPKEVEVENAFRDMIELHAAMGAKTAEV